MGDGGQGESDDRRHPMVLTEDHQETTNGLPVPDELEDGPLLGSYPPHHRPPRRPTPSVEDVTFGIELGEAADVEWRLGLADVGDYDLVVWTATPDHDPAGVQEGEDAFGGEMVAVLTGGAARVIALRRRITPAWVSASTVCRRRALPARLAARPVPNNSATVITWATESILSEW